MNGFQTTLDDLETQNVSPIPIFNVIEDSDQIAHNLFSSSNKNNELDGLRDPRKLERLNRQKRMNIKPPRLLQNNAKGTTRIPMTSNERIEFEILR